MVKYSRLRYEYKDELEWIRIMDTYPENHRYLYFEDSVQGILNLRDATVPALEYVGVMAEGARCFVAEPDRVLIGGLGSCALLHRLEHWWAGRAEILTVEANPKILELGRRFFRLHPRSRVFLGDYRNKLDEIPEQSLDLCLTDCYSAVAIPAHLLSVEYVGLIWRGLKEGGAAVFNYWNPDCNHIVGDQVRTLVEVFSEVGFVKCIDDENLVVFCRKQGSGPRPTEVVFKSRVYPIQPIVLASMSKWPAFMKGCQVIRDDNVSRLIQAIGI